MTKIHACETAVYRSPGEKKNSIIPPLYTRHQECQTATSRKVGANLENKYTVLEEKDNK